jgi:hypothetical protein
MRIPWKSRRPSVGPTVFQLNLQSFLSTIQKRLHPPNARLFSASIYWRLHSLAEISARFIQRDGKEVIIVQITFCAAVYAPVTRTGARVLGALGEPSAFWPPPVWSHHIVDFTHINHLYTIPIIVGGILQSREREHTLILSLFHLFLGAYYILF